MHLERVLPLMQSDKATLSTFEALKVDIGDHISNRIQVFNEKILENIVKQSSDILAKSQKKGDYNIKKRASEEQTNTQASVEFVAYLKPFI
jgi:hypothetical protein